MTLKLFGPRSGIALLVLGPLALAGCDHLATSPRHEVHAHEHDHAGASAPVLNDGRQWPTDAPLRAGMSRIQALVAPTRAGQSVAPAQARALATDVREQVAYLIANCKLEPQADAVLHGLIADMLKGADSLASGLAPEQGIALIRQALEHYPRHFDHPGWREAVDGRQ